MKFLMEVTNKEKRPDLHASIKQVEETAIGTYFISDENPVRVHFAEHEGQWKYGIIRIEIEGKSAEITIDALMSCIFTAYDASVLRSAVGIFEKAWLRIKSLIVKK